MQNLSSAQCIVHCLFTAFVSTKWASYFPHYTLKKRNTQQKRNLSEDATDEAIIYK